MNKRQIEQATSGPTSPQKDHSPDATRRGFQERPPVSPWARFFLEKNRAALMTSAILSSLWLMILTYLALA